MKHNYEQWIACKYANVSYIVTLLNVILYRSTFGSIKLCKNIICPILS